MKPNRVVTHKLGYIQDFTQNSLFYLTYFTMSTILLVLIWKHTGKHTKLAQYLLDEKNLMKIKWDHQEEWLVWFHTKESKIVSIFYST